MFTFPAFHLCAFAPLREVRSWNRQTLESGQSGMLSYWLPVSLTSFHHPSLALPGLHPSFHRIPENFNAIGVHSIAAKKLERRSGDVNPPVTVRIRAACAAAETTRTRHVTPGRSRWPYRPETQPGRKCPRTGRQSPQPFHGQNRPHNPFNPQIRGQHPQTVRLPLVTAVSKLIHVADLHQSPWIALFVQRLWNRSHNSCTSI
jgi:hypothetical protein